MASGRKTKLAKLSVQWEWEGDKSIWQQFPTDTQEELSQAFDKGLTEVTRKKRFLYLI